ncbi:Solute carrier family 35 member F6-like 2 [Homarus americanus]|uniref:Solute carrier family 35 member F6-like 2 n=1 Tax=Homarus americanus TaxID=6706 RepID=A0A8J5MU77_HOMAM|nr:Solute carrier family 35 member F6-like 2 [Homarus americanus]
MGWTGKQMVLALVMVFTGSINTLTAKWADRIQSVNRQGHKTTFSHPFFQADCMFIGEMLCLATFYLQLMITRRSQRDTVEMAPDPHQVVDVPRYIFYLPAICDVTATSMMCCHRVHGVTVGGVLRSSPQVLPLAGHRYRHRRPYHRDLLIVAAQVFTATQMVVEEKFLAKYKAPPLMVVGWEGVFGFLTLSVLLVPMYYIPAGKFSGNERGVLEDAIDAFVQLSNSGTLVASIILTIISIAFFNFAGVSVTKEFSATTRMVLDSVRTLVIWLVTLALRWQTFQYLQPIGYVVLVVGMMLYNDVLILPFLRRRGLVRDQPSESDSQPVIKSTDEIVRRDPYQLGSAVRLPNMAMCSTG